MDLTPKRTRPMLITALLYGVLGAAGISMAVAPGYASPVFPAAGLAVAAMLWSGGRAWPGVWLGSVCLNLGVAWMNGNLNGLSALVALGIAMGSTAQAGLAWWLVQRYVAEAWRLCETESSVFKMLALAGPVACVVSSTVGVSVLVLGGLMPGSAFVHAWWSWWSGDTLGVLVMLPLGLALFLFREPAWQARRLKVATPMLLALTLVVAAYLAVSRWEEQDMQQEVDTIGETLRQDLKARFTAHQESLAALRRLVTLNPQLSYADFDYFTEITLRDNPDIFALSINPYVLAAQRQAFELDYAQRLGEPGFMIRERQQGQLARAANSPVYVPVGYIAPLDGNRAALGFNIYSEPRRQDAIERAIKTRAPSVTVPIQLVQEKRQRVGILVMQPVFREQGPDNKLAHISSLVVGVVKADEMVEITLNKLKLKDLTIRIFDRDAPAGSPDLFSNVTARASDKNSMRYRSDLQIADRIWQLELVPTANFATQKSQWLASAVAIVGLVLATLMQVLLLGVTGRTAVVERRVLEQTAELNTKSRALADRNAQLDAIFMLSPDGLVGFNAQGHVAFTNPAFHTIMAWTPSQVHQMSLADFELRLRTFSGREGPVAGFYSVDTPDDATRTSSDQATVWRLHGPDHQVVEVTAQKAHSESLSHILYFRDITYAAEIDRLKSEFVAHAAHELRTPLTSIHGYSELLLNMDLDQPTQHELLDTIYRHTSNLIKIVNELLDLAQIEQGGGQQLHFERLDLAALATSAFKDVAPDPARWPLHMDKQPQHFWVAGDAGRLRQALLNIMSNAHKYAPDGGPIEVHFVTRPGQFGIEVRDHGLGLSAQQIQQIGQRFWRADKSGKIPGTGLGIGIVKEILALHGGQLQIDSVLGQGSVFTLWLPAADTGLDAA